MAPDDHQDSQGTFGSGFNPRDLLAHGLAGSPARSVGMDGKPGPRTEAVGEEDSVGVWLQQVFPELKLTGCLGRGGGGAVFRAEHRQLKRPLAIKVLSGGMACSPAAIARFEREIEAVGKLDHPGIVQAFDGGQRQGVWFLTMEWVDGVDFGAVSRIEGCLNSADASRLIQQAALALHHAHERGLVHRDVKPGNLMLAAPVADGLPRVKVLDFGLAQVLRKDGAGGELTLSSDFLGTVDYVAPEQIVNPREADARADVYALGATLVRLLLGRAPRTIVGASDSLYQRLIRAAEAPPFRLQDHRDDLAPGLVELVNQMLDGDPDRRPASAKEVAARLEGFSGGADLAGLFRRVRAARPVQDSGVAIAEFAGKRPVRGIRVRPIWWVAGVFLCVAAGVAGVMWWRRPAVPKVLFIDGKAARPTSLGRNWTVAMPPTLVAGVPEPIRGEAHEILLAQRAPLPSMVSDEWVVTRTFRLGSPRSGQFAPGLDGLIFCEGSGQDASVGVIDSQGRYFRRVGGVAAETLALGTDGNLVAWSDPSRRGLGFGKLDLGTLEKRISYRGSPADSLPMGLAFPPPGWKGTGLVPGEGFLVDGGGEDSLGIWRFGFAASELRQVIGDTGMLDQPVDIAFTRDSAYLVNRVRGRNRVGADQPDDFQRRIFRVEGERLVPCTTDVPIADPCGIAWDPGLDDLYVLCGQQLLDEPARRRLLRLRRSEEADRFTVTEVLTGFREPTLAGVDVSPDGQLILVTEYGGQKLGVGFVYLLQRR